MRQGEAGAELSTGTTVVSLRGTSAVVYGYGSAATTTTLQARRVLVAPGAYDRPVAFPGWTLPGVVTAGGAQALVKASRVVPGDRVAFAGSGPLALAFPAQLRHYGVNVVLVLEAGPPPGPRSLLGLLPGRSGQPALLRDAASYRAAAAAPPACRCGTGGSSCGPKGRTGWRRWSTLPWTPTGGSCRAPGAARRRHLCASATGSCPSTELLRLAGCRVRL